MNGDTPSPFRNGGGSRSGAAVRCGICEQAHPVQDDGATYECRKYLDRRGKEIAAAVGAAHVEGFDAGALAAVSAELSPSEQRAIYLLGLHDFMVTGRVLLTERRYADTRSAPAIMLRGGIVSILADTLEDQIAVEPIAREIEHLLDVIAAREMDA